MLTLAAVLFAGLLPGALGAWLLRRKLSPRLDMTAHTVIDRIRGVGRLVALEVGAKEIVTVGEGDDTLWGRARKLIMVFTFQIQYSCDLRAAEVHPGHDGDGRFRVCLPPLERLTCLVDQQHHHEQPGSTWFGLVQRPFSAAERDAMWHQARTQAEQAAAAGGGHLEIAERQVISLLTALFAPTGVQLDVDFAAAPAVEPQRIS